MTTSMLRWDGGCRPTNPGHAGFACVVQIDGIDHVISRYIGWKTNNVAEYFGLIVGIKYSHALGATKLKAVGDSKLVVNQIKREWATRDPVLKGLAMECQTLLDALFLGRWELEWEPRASNIADSYCTEAINWGRNHPVNGKINPWVPQRVRDKRKPEGIRDPFSNVVIPPT